MEIADPVFEHSPLRAATGSLSDPAADLDTARA
jgi:hypothetical protein